MTDDGYVSVDCLYAMEREPLLRDHPRNARRRASLERMRDELRSMGGEDAPDILEFLDHMEPDAALTAWEMLYHKLERAGSALAQVAAAEYRLARSDTWKSMGAGADMIPHLTAMCVRFDEARHEALGKMRTELYTALGSASRAACLDPEMQSYVTNFARFGSRADDEMTLLIVDEMYIRRGLPEGACGICEEILKFEGLDRDRMASSRLFEGIMLKVLGAMENRNKKERGLVPRCRELLERRSDLLKLGIRPNPDENNELRALSDFVSDLSARRRIYPAGEIGRHVAENYPRSHAFLGLGNETNLREMVESRSPLAANLSAHIGAQKAAAARKVSYEGGSALVRLEAMVGLLEEAAPRTTVMGKWREGIRGRQLWESLFEIEMYLRLAQAGADVAPDVRVGKKVVDLEFDGCYAEVYSPLESEVLVPNHVVTTRDPGTYFMGNVLSKGQLGAVGDHETLMVVECPIGLYSNVADLGQKMQGLLEEARQPGGVLFVLATGMPRRDYTLMQNPGSARPLSEATMGTVRRAMELEFPSAETG